MRRKRGDKPTPLQHRSTMENLCIANLVRQQRLFQSAGHYDFQKKAEALEAEFRGKLLTMKER